jgi:hypothetical protein
MARADDLRHKLEQATIYIERIGKSEPHLSTSGRLASVNVTTEVCHQNSPSAQNYWKNADFDAALAQVIREQFPSLSFDALALMRKDAYAALVDEESSLRARLAEIERIKTTA